MTLYRITNVTFAVCVLSPSLIQGRHINAGCNLVNTLKPLHDRAELDPLFTDLYEDASMRALCLLRMCNPHLFCNPCSMYSEWSVSGQHWSVPPESEAICGCWRKHSYSECVQYFFNNCYIVLLAFISFCPFVSETSSFDYTCRIFRVNMKFYNSHEKERNTVCTFSCCTVCRGSSTVK